MREIRLTHRIDSTVSRSAELRRIAKAFGARLGDMWWGWRITGTVEQTAPVHDRMLELGHRELPEWFTPQWGQQLKNVLAGLHPLGAQLGNEFCGDCRYLEPERPVNRGAFNCRNRTIHKRHRRDRVRKKWPACRHWELHQSGTQIGIPIADARNLHTGELAQIAGTTYEITAIEIITETATARVTIEPAATTHPTDVINRVLDELNLPAELRSGINPELA